MQKTSVICPIKGRVGVISCAPMGRGVVVEASDRAKRAIQKSPLSTPYYARESRCELQLTDQYRLNSSSWTRTETRMAAKRQINREGAPMGALLGRLALAAPRCAGWNFAEADLLCER